SGLTTDRQLRAQREALTAVDTLATVAYHIAMLLSQALPIVLDSWQLIDQNGRPVMGNTLRWLGNWLAANKWVRTPSGLLHGPPHYPSHRAREAENMRLEEEPHPVLQADYRDDTTHQRSETPVGGPLGSTLPTLL
ncbi:hypothetical protein DYB30_013951, partial [Aphanomyces astaci]